MSEDIKIVINFQTNIKSCKDYGYKIRDLCVFCQNGRYGLAEKHRNGRLTVLIECKYDFIDPLWRDYSNMVGVLLNGKWGLYVFKYTISSKSNKIDCQKITDCEFDSISTGKYYEIAVLNKRTKCRYYNLNSYKLSPYYDGILFEDEICIGCCSDNTIRWFDIYTDSIIYSTEDWSSPKVFANDIFFFIETGANSQDNVRKADLIFFNRNLMVSYIIKGIEQINVLRNKVETFRENLVFILIENKNKHIITVNHNEWDVDEIKKVAKEVEYL